MGAVVTFFERLAFVWGGGYHGGHDGGENIWYFGIGGKVWAAGGNDTVGGVLAYVNIDKSWGDLNVYGAFGYAGINKWGDGHINVGAAIGYTDINHSGWWGDVNVWGATGGSSIRRSGGWGHVNFGGATGYADIRNYVQHHGDVTFSGAAGGVHLERWGGHSGNINFWGVAGSVTAWHTATWGDINIGGAIGRFEAWRSGHSGNINVWSAAIANKIHHTGSYGDINYHGVGGFNDVYRRGTHGNVNYHGAGGANIIKHEADGGDVNFYGAGAANIITRTVRTNGGVRYYGIGGANTITLNGSGNGFVEFGGGGFANVITHTAHAGNINFFGAGGLNVITRSGHTGNVRFAGAGAGNVVTMTVAQGDLDVYAVGGANVVTRSGAGHTRAYMAGGANVLTNKGSGFTDAKLFGAYNQVISGDGGSNIESYGLGATIITGRGVDHIKSYGLVSVIRSGGAPDGKKDHVEAYGAYTDVDLTGGHRDNGRAGKISVGESFQRVKSAGPVAGALSNVKAERISISGADRAAMSKHGMGDSGTAAIEKSGLNNLGVQQTDSNSVTNEQRDLLARSGRKVDESRLNTSNNRPDAESYKRHVQVDANGSYSAVGASKASAHSVQTTMGGHEYAGARQGGGGNLRAQAQQQSGSQPSEGQTTNEQNKVIGSTGAAGAIEYDDRVDLVGLAAVAGTGNDNDRIHAVSLYNEIHTNGGDDFVLALGAINNIHTGSGNDTAVIMGLGNFANMGDGDDVAVMLNLTPFVPSVNVAQMGGGNDIVVALSWLNIVLKDGDGDLKAFMFGLGNVLLQRGGRQGDQMLAVMGGLLNVAHKEGNGDVLAITLGLANTVSQKGNGNFMAIMGGVLNVATHVGHGEYQAYMLGKANISTKVGDGFSRVAMLGALNVHTGIGNGDAQFYMAGLGNISTKVGDGKVSALMAGAGSVLTVIGKGDLEGVFVAGANIITKVGDGHSAVIMAAFANILTQVGKGNMTAITLGQGNVITKVGDGDVYLLNVAVPLSAFLGAPDVPTANVFTQVGRGNVMGVMVALASKVAGNVFTKVGDGDVATVMIAATPDSLNSFTNSGSKPKTLNLATQVGNGRTYALMFGGGNVFTKVGTGDYANGWDKWDKAKTDAMFDHGERSVANAVNGGMRNMAKGMSPLLANRKFNTIMGAFGSGNIMTEVNHQSALKEFDNTDAVADIIGKKTTNTIMAGIGGYGNVMVKVGDGGFYGVAVANPKDVANYFKIAGGKTGDDPLDGESLGIMFGDIPARPNSIENNSKNGNIIVHVGHGDTNALAIGSTNVMVKVGDGGSKAITLGDNNAIVRVGNAAGTKQAADIAGYRAFDGVHIAFGDRNLVLNHGKSNDIIIALDPNMLTDGDRWNKISSSMNPFPSLVKSDADKAKEDEEGKEITDIFGRKYNSKTNPQGYLMAEERNTFGLKGAIGFSSLFVEGPIGLWKELKEQRIKDNQAKKEKGVDTPDPYGNFVYGGEGSDIILAIGTNNIVFSDSWTSLADFNLEMLYDAGGANKTLSSLGAKLGTFGDMLGSRLMGLGSIPVVGPMLDKLGVSAGFKWLPRTDIGSLTGLKGDVTGDVQFDGSDVGRNWANSGLGVPNWNFTTPQIWTSVAGLFKNIHGIATGENLTRKGEGYTSDQGKEFASGWKSGIKELISAIGVPELLSSINARDSEGRNVWQRFFDRDTAIGWGSMWKNPESFFSGVNLLQDNSDIVTVIGMNNIVFTGEGGDMALTIGAYNSVPLGGGRDISLSWGTDNRVAGGKDNDMLIGVGKSNLLIGGDGNDLVVALGEKNRLTGDGGDDMIVAIGVSNTVVAGGGSDFVLAIGEGNYVVGGGGDDLIIGIGVNNIYNMGGGNDVIINLGFASQSYYGDGSDIAYARGQGDFLDGEADADVFYVDQPSQHNRVHGSAGDDTFYLGGRDNIVNGGADNDTFVVRNAIERVTVEDVASNDRIVIDGSVKISDIWLSRRGSDLLIEIDRWDRVASQITPEIPVGELRFQNWFSSASNRSNLFFDQQKAPSGAATATAKMLSANQVNALVNAMASFKRADASGNFRDNINTPAQNTIASLWSAAKTVDSFSVKAA